MMSRGESSESGYDAINEQPELRRFGRLIEDRLGRSVARKFCMSEHPEVVLRLFQDVAAGSERTYGLVVVGNEQPIEASERSPLRSSYVIDGAPVVTAICESGAWRIHHHTAHKLVSRQLDNPEYFWGVWASHVADKALPLGQPDAKEIADMLEGSIPRLDMLGE